MENTLPLRLAFSHRTRLLRLMYTHVSLYRNIKPPSQRRNCHTRDKDNIHDRCHLTVSMIFHLTVQMRACARTGSPHCSRYFAALVYCPISLFLLFIFFSPSLSFPPSFASFFAVRLYYELLLGSPLSGLGGGHVPWLQRGKITLTH